MSQWYPQKTYKKGLREQIGGDMILLALVKLSDSYTGNCLRIKRVSDNAEQDIGFDSNGYFDMTAFNTFVSSSDTGFVKTWYDQSGAGYNATQSNIAFMPRIVVDSTGFIVPSKPGFPFVYFDGTNDYLSFSGTALTFSKKLCGMTGMVAGRVINQSAVKYLYHMSTGADTNPRSAIRINADNTIGALARSLDGDTTAATTTQANGFNMDVFVNNTNFFTPSTQLSYRDWETDRKSVV